MQNCHSRIGGDGSFAVGSVPAGSYSLFAQEEGTGLSAAYDQTVQVAAGSAVVGVSISVPVQEEVVVAVAPLDDEVEMPRIYPLSTRTRPLCWPSAPRRCRT